MNELKDKSWLRTGGWLSSAGLSGTLRLKLCKSTFSDQVGLSWPPLGLKCVLECSLHFKQTQSLETQPNKSVSLQTYINVMPHFNLSSQHLLGCQHVRVVTDPHEKVPHITMIFGSSKVFFFFYGRENISINRAFFNLCNEQDTRGWSSIYWPLHSNSS